MVVSHAADRCELRGRQVSAALGTPALAALLLPQIFPILPPHRANHARRGPLFSVVAPCHRGASPASVRRRTYGLLRYFLHVVSGSNGRLGIADAVTFSDLGRTRFGSRQFPP